MAIKTPFLFNLVTSIPRWAIGFIIIYALDSDPDTFCAAACDQERHMSHTPNSISYYEHDYHKSIKEVRVCSQFT